ncbi:hypothetical protein [uncultured Desulfovibrio sp.]|uniref:hypothetical protein n=1 Tax=Desulfovibrio legallii TaxID=571438 RepID=UPI00265E1FC2|nr:hypothetical protein [uncultured Desulfovibrio sp.]
MSERHAKIGQREDYRVRLKCVETEICALRDSLRAALPLTADAGELAGDHVVTLAITLNERLAELKGLARKVDILTRDLEG